MDAPFRPARSRQTLARKTNIALLIRRIHLYSGLFLVPWVLLYGFTAVLFNHPNLFQRGERRTTPFPEALRPWTNPDALADQVLAGLAAEKGLAAVPERLGPAAFSGPFYLTWRGETDGTARLDLDGEAMAVSIRPGEVEPPSGPLDGEVAIESGPMQRKLAGDAVLAELATAGIAVGEPRPRSIPSLEFKLRHEGETWLAEYSLDSGEMTTKRVADVQGPPWRSFLTRLHKFHVYEGGPAALLWALIVDVMALAMMTWGLSGIYMWWQMKKLRTIGNRMLVVSVLCALALGAAMYLTVFSG